MNLGVSGLNFTSNAKQCRGKYPLPEKAARSFTYKEDGPLPHLDSKGQRRITLDDNLIYSDKYLSFLKQRGTEIKWVNIDTDGLGTIGEMKGEDADKIWDTVNECVDNMAARRKKVYGYGYCKPDELWEMYYKGKAAEEENSTLVSQIIRNAETIGLGRGAEEALKEMNEFDTAADTDTDTDIDIDIDGFDKSIAEDIDDIIGEDTIEKDND